VSLGPLTIFSCNNNKEQKLPPSEIQVVEVIQKDVPIYREFVEQVYGEKDIPIRARVEGFFRRKSASFNTRL
jgi:membrane fusion protein (multidrug efflux system)